MKRKILVISIVLYLIYGVFDANKSYAQEFKPVKILKEMPDSLLKFSDNWIQPMFYTDIRLLLLSNKYSDEGLTLDLINHSELFNIEDSSENDDEELSSYSVIIETKANWIKLSYMGRYYEASLDFFLIPEHESYTIILLEQYSEFEIPSVVQSISSYYFDKTKTKYIEKDLEIPKIAWSDFYSPEEMLNLNMYYLEKYELHPKISILKTDDELVLSILPNLDAFVKEFYGTMDHVYTEYQNQFEDTEMIKDSIGLNLISEPLPLYYSFPNFNLLDRKQYELINLYNSFCKKHLPDLKLNFVYEDATSSWKILSEDVTYSLNFIDSQMIIESEMMNNLEINSFLVEINNVDYFIVCYNSTEFVSDLQLRVFERDGINLNKELSSDFTKVLKNKDLSPCFD